MREIGAYKRLAKPYRFSKSSQERLDQCCEEIQKIINEVVYFMDITITEGSRTREQQEKYLKAGTSKAKFGQSAHNYTPSLAIDIVPYPVPVNKKGEWDSKSKKWDDLALIVKSIADEKGIRITWGGDFKSIVDKPHWELTDWKSRVQLIQW